MKREQISQKVKELTAEQLGEVVDEIVECKRFVDLGADSLDVVELVMVFEEEFDIEIPDEDGAKFITIEDAIDYICKKKGV